MAMVDNEDATTTPEAKRARMSSPRPVNTQSPEDTAYAAAEAYISSLSEDTEELVFFGIDFNGESGSKYSTLRNIPPLGKFRNLKRLTVCGTKINSLPEIANPGAMRAIDARDTPLTSLKGVEHMVDLETLWISDTKVSSLTELSGLQKCTWLDIERLTLDEVSEALVAKFERSFSEIMKTVFKENRTTTLTYTSVHR